MVHCTINSTISKVNKTPSSVKVTVTLIRFVFFLFNYIDCLPGYTGKNCSSKCPYPSYGTKCQGICNCDSNQCDASRGCRTQTLGKVFVSNGSDVD